MPGKSTIGFGLAIALLATTAGCSTYADDHMLHGDAGPNPNADSGPVLPRGSGGAKPPAPATKDASTAGSGGSTGASGRDASTPRDGGATPAADAGKTPPSSAGASKLPVPPGPDDVAKPSGASLDLQVLPWAGFSSAASYTFDDSQPSHLAHYAELDASGVPLTFYINSSNAAGDALDTWKAALADGHEIANHTVHHCNFDLSGCNGTPSSIDAEIDECTRFITSQVGAPGVWTFAAPFGDKGYEPAAKQRFFLARGTPGGMIAPNDATDPFDLPVFAAAGGESADLFSGQIDMAQAQGKWVIFLFHSLLPTDANWFAGVEIANVTGSIQHAKGLGEVWIDTLAHVGAYWRAQQVFTAIQPSTDGDITRWSWTVPDHFPPGTFLRVTIAGGKLMQGAETLAWDSHGYYEVAFDRGELTWKP